MDTNLEAEGSAESVSSCLWTDVLCWAQANSIDQFLGTEL